MPKFVLALTAIVIFATPLLAPAGDEVDYSAPYLVVEDGELVTKYPAKEHAAALAAADMQAGETTASPEQNRAQDKGWAFVAAAIGVVIALLLLIWRGWQQRA